MAQIKTKKRVVDYGEVFTNEREVKAMVDLVSEQAKDVESTFLEPACGDGNFLIEILSRKLLVIKKKFKKLQFEYEVNLFKVATSLYGIDLLEDNIKACQNRLLIKIINEYCAIYKEKISVEVIDAIRYVLSKNILCGNALDMKHSDGSFLIIAEWSTMNSGLVKRRDFVFEELMKSGDSCKPLVEEQMTINELGKSIKKLPKNVFIPRSIMDYPQIDYRRVSEHEFFDGKTQS